MDTKIRPMTNGKVKFGENFQLDTEFEYSETGDILPKIVIYNILFTL
jgi:hypothetical protein